MEQQNTNTTPELIEMPENIKPVSRGELSIAPRQIEVPERIQAAIEEQRARAAEAAEARQAEAREIAAKIGEGAVAAGLPDTNPYATESTEQ